MNAFTTDEFGDWYELNDETEGEIEYGVVVWTKGVDETQLYWYPPGFRESIKVYDWPLLTMTGNSEYPLPANWCFG